MPQLILHDVERPKLLETIKQSLDLGDGFMSVRIVGHEEETTFSQYFVCAACDLHLPVIEPRSFSLTVRKELAPPVPALARAWSLT